MPLIVAHRGASHDAPENTLPAFELAWQQGAKAIEGDFHLTRDKRVICIHDSNTRKYGGPHRVVRKSILAELKRIDAGSWKGEQWTGTRFPSLDEVLQTIPNDGKLYLEIKSSPRILRHLYKAVDASKTSSRQIVVIAFSARVIRKLKRERPEFKAFLLSDLETLSDDRLLPSPESLVKAARNCHADGLSVFAHPDFSKEHANTILDSGLSLHTWTIDDPKEAQRWTALGAQSITTNKPALLLETVHQ